MLTAAINVESVNSADERNRRENQAKEATDWVNSQQDETLASELDNTTGNANAAISAARVASTKLTWRARPRVIAANEAAAISTSAGCRSIVIRAQSQDVRAQTVAAPIDPTPWLPKLTLGNR